MIDRRFNSEVGVVGFLGVAGFLPTVVVALFAAILVPPPSLPESEEYSAVFLDADERVLRVFLNPDEQWILPRLEPEAIPAKLEAAVLVSEDRYFYRHPGVNPFSIVRALIQNIREGRIVSGGSTITMQLARILDPKPRTIPAKIVELLQALRLETRYSKRGILSLYLSHAPYGGNVIGVSAASLRYFGKEATELTWAQATTLAVLPRNPGMAYPGADDRRLRVVRDRLLSTLTDEGYIDERTLGLALEEKVPDREEPFPLRVPHFTRYLHEELGRRSGVHRTFIDLDIQHDVERTVRSHAAYLSSLGIENAAVLIAETATGRIKSYMGSVDFFNERIGGRVDGVRSPRSSGSILKPFLYALSIDSGLIVPKTMIMDVPTSFGTFNPQNIGMSYSGMIQAGEALQRSLNVPAVRLLGRYGHRDFHLFLRHAGLTTLFRSPDDYGLTLILGGAETKLYDLVRLYRGLGNGGVFLPLVPDETFENEYGVDRSEAEALVSPGASKMILDVLREVKRPGLESWWRSFSESRPLAWKTGTSYGNRDAWAVGVSPEWTVGVWVGNFSGRENVNLRSTTCSAPLLFDLFNSLPKKDGERRWFEAGSDAFREETICLDTGYLAGEACEHTAVIDVPRFAAPLRVCPYHETVFFDSRTGYEVCSRCWDPDHVVETSRLNIPADATQYMREQGAVLDEIPRHNPDCPVHGTETGITILYPKSGAHLFVPRGVDGELQQVNARAAVQRSSERLYWYIDGDFAGQTTDRHAMPLNLSGGFHELLIVDSGGKRTRSVFDVAVSVRANRE